MFCIPYPTLSKWTKVSWSVTYVAVFSFSIEEDSKTLRDRHHLVWFVFCFMALQHIFGHSGRSQLSLPHCLWASLLGSLPVLSAHSFACNWQLLFLNQRKRGNGRRNFSWPSLHEIMCRTWGSNSGPLACQADTLPIKYRDPGRFAHFPVRPWVVSPTFPFAPNRFAPGSFRPLSRWPLSLFAHFPVRPWVVSPPYKILFLVLLFRPQKWYKALIFLLIFDFSL